MENAINNFQFTKHGLSTAIIPGQEQCSDQMMYAIVHNNNFTIHLLCNLL